MFVRRTFQGKRSEPRELHISHISGVLFVYDATHTVIIAARSDCKRIVHEQERATELLVRSGIVRLDVSLHSIGHQSLCLHSGVASREQQQR